MSTDFEQGSPLHLLTLMVCLAAVLAASCAGRHWRDRSPSVERAIRIAWAVSVVALQVGWQVWQNLPRQFDLRYSLPLHLCDLVIWAVPFALFTKNRPARALLYFWGAGLTLFAFLFPILREGPTHVAFWMFWIGHTQIIGSAVYLVVVLRYRPVGRDVRIAWLATCVYVAVVLPFDALLGLDYGNVGPDPSSTGALGPWPLRVGVVLLLQGILFALLWLPWRNSQFGAGRRGRASRRG